MNKSSAVHIYLIGYRGSGKSTVGRKLATRLGVDFVDTDDLIEQTAGKTIQQIFADQGESGFRDLEQAVIASVASQSQRQVVSLGGGAITRGENCRQLEQTGQCVWLRAPAELLYGRIMGDQSSATRRPNLSASGGYDEVVDILAAREPIYGRLAKKTVDIASLSPDEVVTKIVDWVESNDP